GLYARNSIPAIETLLTSCKLRGGTANINYRYTESELRYMFSDADLVALVHDREFTPQVAAVAKEARDLRGTLVVDDGTDAGLGDGADYEAALASASPERDFPPRSPDDVYLLYTGGRPATRRASCGATRTSGARSAGASTSPPGSRSRTSGSSRGAAWKRTG